MSQDALRYSLQALAQPADFQRRLLDVWHDPPDELPERFVQAHRHVLANAREGLTKSQADVLEALHTKFRSFCGPSNAEHWREEALDTSPHWEAVRRVARICLERFGWSTEQPPLDTLSYGEDFYEGPGADFFREHGAGIREREEGKQ
jgi:hypothetical protein